MLLNEIKHFVCEFFFPHEQYENEGLSLTLVLH